ncbi:MAG: hypothetical protein WB535_10270, partial [Paenarthrobacter sp.]
MVLGRPADSPGGGCLVRLDLPAPAPEAAGRTRTATAEDADAGRIPVRDAHQRLSFLVREFAGAATGLPVTSMTLE